MSITGPINMADTLTNTPSMAQISTEIDSIDIPTAVSALLDKFIDSVYTANHSNSHDTTNHSHSHDLLTIVMAALRFDWPDNVLQHVLADFPIDTPALSASALRILLHDGLLRYFRADTVTTYTLTLSFKPMINPYTMVMSSQAHANTAPTMSLDNMAVTIAQLVYNYGWSMYSVDTCTVFDTRIEYSLKPHYMLSQQQHQRLNALGTYLQTRAYRVPDAPSSVFTTLVLSTVNIGTGG